MALFKKALLRSVYLFVVGLLMLALAWGPEQIWQWDILTLMGFATLVLYFCRFLPSWLILLLGTAGAADALAAGLGQSGRHLGRRLFVADAVHLRVPAGLFVEPAHELPSVWRLDINIQRLSDLRHLPGLSLADLPTGRLCLWPAYRGAPLSAGSAACGDRRRRRNRTGPGGAFAEPGKPTAEHHHRLSRAAELLPRLIHHAALPVGDRPYRLCLSLLLVRCTPAHRQDGGVLHPHLPPHEPLFADILFPALSLIGWPLLLVVAFSDTYLIYDFMDAWPALIGGLVAVTLLELLLVLWERHETASTAWSGCLLY